MSNPDIRWQRALALRHIEQLKAELKGQPASDQFLAEKAARYVGATAANVLAWMTTAGNVLTWMKGRP
jgi:hypothetical protein